MKITVTDADIKEAFDLLRPVINGPVSYRLRREFAIERLVQKQTGEKGWHLFRGGGRNGGCRLINSDSRESQMIQGMHDFIQDGAKKMPWTFVLHNHPTRIKATHGKIN